LRESLSQPQSSVAKDDFAEITQMNSNTRLRKCSEVQFGKHKSVTAFMSTF